MWKKNYIAFTIATFMDKALGISKIMFLDEIPGSEVTESRVCPIFQVFEA